MSRAGMFSVATTAHFDRLAKALAKRHRKVFLSAFEETLVALRTDPYNSTRRFAIKKLTRTVDELLAAEVERATAILSPAG